jgi:hypothetical protein
MSARFTSSLYVELLRAKADANGHFRGAVRFRKEKLRYLGGTGGIGITGFEAGSYKGAWKVAQKAQLIWAWSADRWHETPWP